jgi:hypothetical protein
MDKNDKKLVLDALVSASKLWLDYKLRPPKPLDASVKTHLDGLLGSDVNEGDPLLKKIVAFVGKFDGKIDPDLIDLLDLKKKEVEDAMPPRPNQFKPSTPQRRLNLSRNRVRRRVSGVFYVDEQGNAERQK